VGENKLTVTSRLFSFFSLIENQEQGKGRGFEYQEQS